MFNLEIPINSMSFGQMGWGVAYELYQRKLEPNIFPIGEVNLAAFKPDTNFQYWLTKCCKKAPSNYKNDSSTISLWHINGSHKRLTNRTALWTAYEASKPTQTEVNICRKFDKVFFTSNYAKENFLKAGLYSSDFCPNFFDSVHLKNLGAEYNEINKPVTFGLVGKMEKRKNTQQILVSWANMFGNKQGYQLICCVFNPFVHPDAQIAEINRIFNGQKPWNIEFLPFTEKNSEFNKILDRIDIDLSGLSGAEGWGLPCFNSICLGKVSIVLNAHAHKDYADSDNSILVEPSGMIDIYDGMFFRPGEEFNQGDMYTFSQEAAQEAYKKSLDIFEKCGKVGKQSERFSLQEKFSVKNTVDKLLEWVG